MHNPEDAKRILEAALLASQEPLQVQELKRLFDQELNVETLRKLLALTAEFAEGSFLVVLKLFGDKPSPGLLSFPLPGATLALDFPNKGASTQRLLAAMADIVIAAGGRLYPAKDATMSPLAFRTGYPAWRKLEAQRDPAMMSDFWRRVTAEAA